MEKRPSCIVLGAGLAGLAAGYCLTKARWKVTVLEAQNRFGGRVLSHRFKEEAPGLVCELGAEWIGADHKRMLALCEEFKLDLKDHRFSLSFWNGVGKRSRSYAPEAWCFRKSLLRKFNRFAKKYENLSDSQAKELDDYDWWRLLAEMGFSQKELERRELMDSTDSGETIRLTSAYSAAGEYCLPVKSKTDEMDFKIVGGNHRLIDKLVEAIRVAGDQDFENEVLKDAPVEAIVQKGNRVHVRLHGHRKDFQAPFCICTVPTRALLDIEWSPRIARPQWNMARQLQYSRIMKSAVLFNSRFWKTPRSGGFSVFTYRASDFCFDSTYGQDADSKGILCSYAIGDKADDLASEPNDNNVMKWISEDAAVAVQPGPKVPVSPIRIRRQPWQREKWIEGAYAFYQPGQWFVVMKSLRTPHKQVYFAGEHLSEENQGFMEGAVESGEKAARDLIARAGMGPPLNSRRKPS
jgi:monoamine oxidase